MGSGYCVLVWDSFGAGLVRVNPRLVTDGTFDMYGNPTNWWPGDEKITNGMIVCQLRLDKYGDNYLILRS